MFCFKNMNNFVGYKTIIKCLGFRPRINFVGWCLDLRSWVSTIKPVGLKPIIAFMGFKSRFKFIRLEPRINFVFFKPKIERLGFHPKIKFMGLSPELNRFQVEWKGEKKGNVDSSKLHLYESTLSFFLPIFLIIEDEIARKLCSSSQVKSPNPKTDNGLVN